jgi:hypothetical protein
VILQGDTSASFSVFDCETPLAPDTSQVTLCGGDNGEVTGIGLTRGARTRSEPWISIFSFSPRFERGVEYADFANWALLHLAEDLSADVPEGQVRKWIIRDISSITSIDPEGQQCSITIDGTVTTARRWNAPGEGWVVAASLLGCGVAISAHCVDDVPSLIRADESVWQSVIQSEVRDFTENWGIPD